jgi:hypothetical protein
MQHKHGIPQRWTGRAKLYPVQEPAPIDEGPIADDRQLEIAKGVLDETSNELSGLGSHAAAPSGGTREGKHGSRDIDRASDPSRVPENDLGSIHV